MAFSTFFQIHTFLLVSFSIYLSLQSSTTFFSYFLSQFFFLHPFPKNMFSLVTQYRVFHLSMVCLIRKRSRHFPTQDSKVINILGKFFRELLLFLMLLLLLLLLTTTRKKKLVLICWLKHFQNTCDGEKGYANKNYKNLLKLDWFNFTFRPWWLIWSIIFLELNITRCKDHNNCDHSPRSR